MIEFWETVINLHLTAKKQGNVPLEVKHQERESSQGLIRRFSNKIRQSGILVQARKIRFKKKARSHGLKKKAALRRETLKKEYEKLEKLGQTKK